MNCCDEYGNCRQGRDCPARVAKVGQRMPDAEPLPPSTRILALTPHKPLFGHKSGKQQKTHWVTFMKPNAKLSGPNGPQETQR